MCDLNILKGKISFISQLLLRAWYETMGEKEKGRILGADIFQCAQKWEDKSSPGNKGSATGKIVAQGEDTRGKGKPEGQKKKLEGWVRI